MASPLSACTRSQHSRFRLLSLSLLETSWKLQMRWTILCWDSAEVDGLEGSYVDVTLHNGDSAIIGRDRNRTIHSGVISPFIEIYFLYFRLLLLLTMLFRTVALDWILLFSITLKRCHECILLFIMFLIFRRLKEDLSTGCSLWCMIELIYYNNILIIIIRKNSYSVSLDWSPKHTLLKQFKIITAGRWKWKENCYEKMLIQKHKIESCYLNNETI